MGKKTRKSNPKTFLEIAIKSAAGKHVARISGVAELKDALQQYLPALDPYAAQATAHLVVIERATIDAGRWQIQIVGEWILQPIETTQKPPAKARAVAAHTTEAASVPARDPVQSQQAPAPLFPEPQNPEKQDL